MLRAKFETNRTVPFCFPDRGRSLPPETSGRPGKETQVCAYNPRSKGRRRLDYDGKDIPTKKEVKIELLKQAGGLPFTKNKRGGQSIESTTSGPDGTAAIQTSSIRRPSDPDYAAPTDR